MRQPRIKLFISIFLGVWLMFFTWHWAIFLVGSIVISSLLYFSGDKAILFYKNIIEKSYKKALKNIILTVIFLILAGVLWLISLTSSTFTGNPMPYLRTNVLTGECSLNKYSDQSDPWYYKSGCNTSAEEKINLLKNDYRFEYIKTQCEIGSSTTKKLSWDEVTCEDLFK